MRFAQFEDRSKTLLGVNPSQVRYVKEEGASACRIFFDESRDIYIPLKAELVIADLERALAGA